MDGDDNPASAVMGAKSRVFAAIRRHFASRIGARKRLACPVVHELMWYGGGVVGGVGLFPFLAFAPRAVMPVRPWGSHRVPLFQ